MSKRAFVWVQLLRPWRRNAGAARKCTGAWWEHQKKTKNNRAGRAASGGRRPWPGGLRSPWPFFFARGFATKRLLLPTQSPTLPTSRLKSDSKSKELKLKLQHFMPSPLR
jgi:hypothetical protein